MAIEVIQGDCTLVMRGLAAESIDACVTDPPYELGFRGKKWDSTGVSFRAATWAEVLRVLKPGGHLLAFGGTRTFHRMAVAIEDAGFDIRDTLMWLYGTGFPKSNNLSKEIDKAAGAKRDITRAGARVAGGYGGRWDMRDSGTRERQDKPATDAARQWSGWRTLLKPAWEPIIIARKPLIGTVAENVLRHGTGAINIDACRVEAPMDGVWELNNGTAGGERMFNSSPKMGEYRTEQRPAGRFPSNVLTDGSDEVVGAFPETTKSPSIGSMGGGSGKTSMFGFKAQAQINGYGGSGTAARFFYSSKASKTDRAGSKHLTVKPVALMRYLCRLVTPPGGTVLDPFAGSGTTLQAARDEGFNAVGIEREGEYIADIRRRLGQGGERSLSDRLAALGAAIDANTEART